MLNKKAEKITRALNDVDFFHENTSSEIDVLKWRKRETRREIKINNLILRSCWIVRILSQFKKHVDMRVWVESVLLISKKNRNERKKERKRKYHRRVSI